MNIDPNKSRRGEIVDIKSVARIASFHPDLHIFAVVEDIDAIAGNRQNVASTSEFLHIDSTGSDSYPRNLHIFATTNRPDVIDPAVTRPGRTAKIIVYEDPGEEAREKIIRFHSGQNRYHLSDKLIADLVGKTEGLTPDEIRYLFWSLRFENVKRATMKAIDKYINDVRSRRKIEKEAKKLFKDTE